MTSALPASSASQDMLDPASDPTAEPTAPVMYAPAGWEKWAVAAALAVYGVWQVNAILHHGTWGQDFIGHMRFIAMAYHDPWKFWTTYIEGQNNPPLFHLLCAGVYRLTGHRNSLEVISSITMTLNMIAVYQLHRLSLRLIGQAMMRVAAVVFVTFLPVGMIHAVVLAADGVATPTVVLLMYLLVRLAEAGRGPAWRFVLLCAAAMLTLAFAVNIKFTAVSLVPAAGCAIAFMWLARAASLRRAALALLIVVGPPAVVGFRTYRQYRAQQQGALGISANYDPFTNELNVRSILFFRAADYKVLDAPRYDRSSKNPSAIPGHQQFELGTHNKYSYIALLHLGVFTDLLNVYQYDPRDNYFGPRSRGAQKRMALAVKTAVPFTLCALVAVPWVLVSSGYGVMVRRDRRGLAALIILTVSFAFFLIIVVFLPFTGALGGGYWLPRLIVPALFGFFLVTFAFLSRTAVGTTELGRRICLGYVIFQSALSLSFLWPWGANGPPAPALHELLPSDLAVKAEMDVKFSPRPPGTAEPLLTIGRYGVAYYLFVRHDDQGNVRIAFNRFGSAQVPESEPFPADPGRAYHIEIQADPDAHALLVTVDGREALRVTSLEPLPVFRDEVNLLKNPAGGAVAGETFSGAAVSSRLTVTGGERWGAAK